MAPNLPRMRVLSLLWLLPIALLPTRGHAQTRADVTATWSLAVVGIPLAELQAHLAYTPQGYDLDMRTHTTGIADVIVRGAQDAQGHGAWGGIRPLPRRYATDGIWNGDPHRTVIDYAGGVPVVKALVPPEKPNHLPVPPEMLHETVDSMAVFAGLSRQVAKTGRCDLSVHLFDGLHVFAITGHTTGEETLGHDSQNVFSGRALRCDFEGSMIAGFTRGDEAKQHKILHATAWIARIGPDWPPLPVKARFETRFFGDAVANLTAPMPMLSPASAP